MSLHNWIARLTRPLPRTFAVSHGATVWLYLWDGETMYTYLEVHEVWDVDERRLWDLRKHEVFGTFRDYIVYLYGNSVRRKKLIDSFHLSPPTIVGESDL